MNSTPLTARALLFLVALTLVYSALGIIAILREGSWEQVPSWDCAHFHTLAIQAKRAVAADGLSGLATFWAHGTGVHAPLVPVTSGLFQLILGEHRWAAELVLVLGTFGLVTGTYVATTCLYGEATAYAVSALTLALPTVLGLSRTYFFEHPFTGLFALSMAALLSSDGLSKWRPIVLFGVLAGFASVTRTGAAVLFVGPAAVMSIGALRQSQPMTRLLRLVAGALLAIAIAATWYGPNLSAILQYIRSNTYGAHAGFFAGGSAFSFPNFLMYVEANVVEGFGVPLAALTIVAYILAGIGTRGRSLVSWIMGGLALAWWIDFILLLAGAQRVGARYFEPLMPFIAIAIVRAVACIPWMRLRIFLGVLVALGALHHVYGMTLGFAVPHASMTDGTAFIGPFRAWNHRSIFLDSACTVAMKDPRANLEIPEVVDRLEALNLPPGSFVYVLADHPFFQVNAIELEAVRRGHNWSFGTAPLLQEPDSPAWTNAITENLQGARAVVVREGGVSTIASGASGGSAASGDYAVRAKAAFEAMPVPWIDSRAPIALGDGSIARVLRMPSSAEVCRDVPLGLQAGMAQFEGKPFELEGRSVVATPKSIVVTISLRCRERPTEAPASFVHLLDGDRIIASKDEPAVTFSADAVPAEPPWRIVLRSVFVGERAQEAIVRRAQAAFGLLINPTTRVKVSRSDLPLDDVGTRIRLGPVR